jgi:hypothetical protein|tara:strand:- start:1380 stop:1517 length:138 start_codon:yes stop_codon:yes gene_type:complete
MTVLTLAFFGFMIYFIFFFDDGGGGRGARNAGGMDARSGWKNHTA